MYRTTEPLAVPVANEEAPAAMPGGARLLSAYPNPSSGAVVVPFVLGAAAWVEVAVFDALGRQVAVVHRGVLSAGTHALGFDTSALPSGVYVLRAMTDEGAVSRAITLTGH